MRQSLTVTANLRELLRPTSPVDGRLPFSDQDLFLATDCQALMGCSMPRSCLFESQSDRRQAACVLRQGHRLFQRRVPSSLRDAP